MRKRYRVGAAIAATAIAVAAGVVAVWLGGWFDGNDSAWWTSLGTWVYTSFTAALAIGAFLAWRAAQDQLREAEAARSSGLRPHVVIDGRRRAEGDGITVSLRNVGPGPALDVAFTAFDTRTDTRVPFGVDAIAGNGGVETVKLTYSAFGPQTDASGGSFDAGALSDGTRLTLERAFAISDFVYWDVFGNRFTERPFGFGVTADDVGRMDLVRMVNGVPEDTRRFGFVRVLQNETNKG